jgi:hypothetical protein
MVEKSQIDFIISETALTKIQATIALLKYGNTKDAILAVKSGWMKF